MRARLPRTLSERRRSRADQHARRAALPAAPVPVPAPAAPVAPAGDPAVERVRRAGGPLDEASYICVCGLHFRAAVSTTVACPHCREPQSW